MIRILHLADLHLDTPFSGLPSDISSILRQDLKGAFKSAISMAKNNGVKIALLAGDLFDNEYTKSSTAQFLIKTMRDAPDIKFFIAPGNHDCAVSTSIYELYSFPENVHIFKSDSIECIEYDDLNVCIYGIGAILPHCDSRVLKGFSVQNTDRINIMVLHGMTSDSSGNTPYYPITAEDITKSGLDYLALGHIHSFSGIKKLGDTFYAYPGCTFGRGFDELSKKGVIEGYIGKGIADLSFVPVAKRSFEIRDIVLNNEYDYEDIAKKISESIEDVRNGNMIRIRLKGTVRSNFIINTAVLSEMIDGPLYLEIEDKTKVQEDIYELAKENTLKGLFVKRILEQMKNETDEEKLMLIDRALRYGLAALANEEVSF